jgi:hypothetical protein
VDEVVGGKGDEEGGGELGERVVEHVAILPNQDEHV